MKYRSRLCGRVSGVPGQNGVLDIRISESSPIRQRLKVGSLEAGYLLFDFVYQALQPLFRSARRMLQTIWYPNQPSCRRLDAVTMRHLHLGQEFIPFFPQNAEENGVFETATGERPCLCRHSPFRHHDSALEVGEGPH